MKSYHKILFLSFLLFNVILRYPEIYLQQGSDSFGNHLISQGIVDQGNDKRYINALSFFGLFPGSNNMGSAFILSGLSSVSGASILDCIFIFNMLESLLGSISCFLLVRRIISNDDIAIFSIILFGTSRQYLDFTEFTYTYRALYVSLHPLFLLLVFTLFDSSGRTINKFLLLVILTLAMFSIHRLVFLNGILVFTIIAYIIIERIKNRFNYSKKLSSVQFFIFYSIFLLLFYILAIYDLYIYSGASDETLEEGKKFFDSDALIYTIINVGLLYSMDFGILLPIVAVGYVSLFFNQNKYKNFILIFLYFYSLVWIDITYGFLYFLPFIVILVSFALEDVRKRFINTGFSKSSIFAFFVVILLSIQTIPEFVVVRETKYTIYNNPEYSREFEYIKGYEAGVYLKERDSSIPVIPSSVGGPRMTVYSGSYSPYHTELYNNSEYYPYSAVTISRFLTGDLNYLYAVTDDSLNRRFGYDVLKANKPWDDNHMQTNVNHIFRGNDLYILAVPDNSPYLIRNDRGEWVESIFLKSAIDENFKFYENGFHALYFLDYN